MNIMSQSLRTMCAAVMLAGVLCGAELRAQGDFPRDKATSYLTIGPTFAGGASMSISPPDGRKVAPSFAWRFGADMTYPLTPVVAGTFMLGYESRAVRLRGLNSSDVYESNRVGYLAITPGFQFGGFWVGMNFGLPLGGGVTRKNGPNSQEVSKDMDDEDFEKVDVTLEPRIGGVIPIHNDATGLLAITLNGGISLNQFFDITDANGVVNESLGNYQTVSAHMGISYQFAIQGTEK